MNSAIGQENPAVNAELQKLCFEPRLGQSHVLEIVVNCCYCTELLRRMEPAKVVQNDAEHKDYQIREVVFSLVSAQEGDEPPHPQPIASFQTSAVGRQVLSRLKLEDIKLVGYLVFN